ncbi:MAG: hypothetical protein RBS56_04485 [Candidatus Gracilibacteria bacterium]|jgi:hypothetical protein|nr:hypothetical protein [Candidatus Gracilibacteria bacterium]
MAEQKTKIEETSEELVFKPRSVAKKRVIFVETDDELIDLYEKLKQVKAKNVYFVIPQRALIFQSIVNLKILKTYGDNQKKKISFITNDTNGISLAKQLGIKVYDKVNNHNSPSLFSSKSEDDIIKITPLKASVNAIIDHTPTRLSEKKLSISELLNKGKRNISSVEEISSNEKTGVNNSKSKTKKEKSPYKLRITTGAKGPIVAFLSLAFVVIFAIFYIALPSATVILTPSAGVLEKSVNITLADFNRNQRELDTHPVNTIASFTLSKEISREIKYGATGKKISEKGGNSTGSIRIINSSSNVWPLIARTRFQTPEGIVFRIKSGVTVPANGSTTAIVEADAVDAYGQIVGERGNIGPTRFFLPALDEESRSFLYAESSENMTGGITDFVSFVSENDIEAAKKKLSDLLRKDLISEIKAEIQKISDETSKSTEYILLEGDNAIEFGDINFSSVDNVLNSEIPEFTIGGSIKAKALYYDRTAMLEILKAELITQKSPNKELLRINEDSTSYKIFQRDDAVGKIKMTANIKGIEQYDIDPETENGKKILEKIRNHIAGKEIEYAKSYIQNLAEVNKVEIRSWPAWSPTIPKIEENIEFEVREAVIVN